MKKILPFCLALTCAFSATPAQGNGCVDRLQPCLDRCAEQLADCQDTDYICNLQNTHCKNSCEGEHQARISTRGKKISEYARDCIWVNYPKMQDAIDLINAGVFSGLIDYALYPRQGYSSPRGIPTSVDKIAKSDMDTPEYFLLLKIWDPESYIFRPGPDVFGSRGVPSPLPGTGEWYFAKGLKFDSSTNENDLLNAFYIGAVGDPAGAEPIIDGSYLKLRPVRRRVMQMMQRGGVPKGREPVYKLAYLYETLCPQCEPGVYAPDLRIRDRNLTELTAGVLSRIIGAPYGTLYENLTGADSRFPIRLRR